MPRNIVLCCDGTANEFARHNTNVVKLYAMLQRDPAVQVTYYHPGLGTMEPAGALTTLARRTTKLLGMAFGYGLRDDIRDAYVFLMRNFAPGDKVYLFGFSRGAYTARAVASLLHMYGLIHPDNDALVPYVIRMMMGIERGRAGRGDREALDDYFDLARAFKTDMSRIDCKPWFVGVWDTVSSVGWIENPLKLPYIANNPDIEIGRHAIAIDERRAFFRTHLWRAPADSSPTARAPRRQAGLVSRRPLRCRRGIPGGRKRAVEHRARVDGRRGRSRGSEGRPGAPRRDPRPCRGPGARPTALRHPRVAQGVVASRRVRAEEALRLADTNGEPADEPPSATHDSAGSRSCMRRPSNAARSTARGCRRMRSGSTARRRLPSDIDATVWSYPMTEDIQIRLVHVEFLRPGPPHNQLLSPLTQYLAIAGDTGAGVVTVPYEQAEFWRRLKELRYESGDPEDRLAMLHATGVEMGKILGSVPGLPGALTDDPNQPGTLIQLRITLSASELAMLPFELAKSPVSATSTAENWLSIQTRPPVCVTRNIRTVSPEGVVWPHGPASCSSPAIQTMCRTRTIVRRWWRPSSRSSIPEGMIASI